MKPDAVRSSAMPPALGLFVLAAIALVVLRAFLAEGAALDRLTASDNDDIMRFLSVRDWLSGQSWFDMHQYGVLAPEGLSLHWSRYVDAGIATLFSAAALVLSEEQAMAYAVSGWPVLLLAGLMIATAWTGARLFGAKAAGIAVIFLVVWPLIGNNYFRAARLDHHNVQIFLLALVVFTLVTPRPSLRSGTAGGVFAALSLAVGLENIPGIALAGIILAVGAATRPDRNGPQLRGFSLGLCFGSVVFFAGQTPPAEWALTHCDQLSKPFLGITVIVLAASLIFTAMASLIPSLGSRVLLLSGLGVASVSLMVPLLLPCTAGPYGNLPPEVRAIIADRIVEARPAYLFAVEGHDIFFFDMVPLISALVLATLVWARNALRPAHLSEVHRAAAVLLAFGWLGALGMALQFRLIVIAVPVVPLLAGYALGHLLDWSVARRPAPLPTLLFLAAGAVTLFAPSFYGTFKDTFAVTPAPAKKTVQSKTGDCRSGPEMRQLNRLEPGTILSPLDLGAPILLWTGHDVTSAPYHRSSTALANGIVPFQGKKADMRRALVDSGADYLVLCTDRNYGGFTGFVQKVEDWAADLGLTRLTKENEPLTVFGVGAR